MNQFPIHLHDCDSSLATLPRLFVETLLAGLPPRLFVPFDFDTAPRRAVEAALAALPPETCPRHHGEPLALDRLATLRDFSHHNCLELSAYRSPEERNTRRLWYDTPHPPVTTLPASLDTAPAVALAQWRATIATDRSPLAVVELSLLPWFESICRQAERTRLDSDAARSITPPGHYVLCPTRQPCLACAVAAVRVPPLFQRASFANFDSRDGQLTEHLAVCQAFAEAPTGFLLLMGTTGGGKSHLAAAIVRATVLGRLKPLFLSHQRLLELHRQHYQPFDPDNPPEDIIGQCRAAGILVLDDLGRRRRGVDEEDILHSVLNHRHEYGLPTVLTGNLDRAGLHAVLGDALFDRLSENNYAYLTFVSGEMKMR